MDDESRRVDRAGVGRRRTQADRGQQRRRHAAGVVSRRAEDRHAQSAACRLRVGPLEPRHRRCLERAAADGLHDTRPVGRGFQVLARRKVDSVHGAGPRCGERVFGGVSVRNTQGGGQGRSGRWSRGGQRLRRDWQEHADCADRSVPRLTGRRRAQAAHARERELAQGDRLRNAGEPDGDRRGRRAGPVPG